MGVIMWLIRHRQWPSRNQRDFMSGDPVRRARVTDLADRILREIREEDGK